MIIFRPNRELLEDSMKLRVEFGTIEAMKEYIVKEFSVNDFIKPFDVDDIVIDEMSVNDERTGWKDTRYVCVKRFCKHDYMEEYGCPQCIGMCATDYENE